MLISQIAAHGWVGTLVDLSCWPATNELAPGRLGACVTLATVADCGGAMPAHLADAAAQAGSPAVRQAATTGGNCAPEVSGCVYLTLLSMASRTVTLTAAGQCERPLRRWHTGAEVTALVEFRWEAVAGGGFARSDRITDNGLPVCAVAVTVPAASPRTLRIAVGYVVRQPIILTVPAQHLPQARRAIQNECPATCAEEFDVCLRRALRLLG